MRYRARTVLPDWARSALSRNRSVALDGLSDAAIERHMAICEWLLDVIGGSDKVGGKRFCEIGPSDCRATQLLIAYLGADGVDVVEPNPKPIDTNDEKILNSLVGCGL